MSVRKKFFMPNRVAENALNAIYFLKTSVSILPFGEQKLSETISLMRKDSECMTSEMFVKKFKLKLS